MVSLKDAVVSLKTETAEALGTLNQSGGEVLNKLDTKSEKALETLEDAVAGFQKTIEALNTRTGEALGTLNKAVTILDNAVKILEKRS